MRRLYYIIQIIISVGLISSGTLLSLGFIGNYSNVVQLGTFGGYAFGLLSAVVYLFALILTFIRSTAKEFWCSLNTFNFGLTLVAVITMFSKTEVLIIFAWIILMGLTLSILFYRWHFTESIYSVIAVHGIFIMPMFRFLSSITEIIILPIAIMFIVIPTLCMAYTREKGKDKGIGSTL